MKNKFKVGDYFKYRTGSEGWIAGYASKIGSYGLPIQIEREDGQGWKRDGAVPKSYVSHASDTYWSCVGPESDFEHLPLSKKKPKPSTATPLTSRNLDALYKKITAIQNMSPINSSGLSGFSSFGPMIMGSSGTSNSSQAMATPKKKTGKKIADFKVGDRVRCITPFADEKAVVGKTGTIIQIRSELECGVSFDDWTYGHNLDGLLTGSKSGTGRWGHPESLELIAQSKPKPKKIDEKALDALVLEESIKKEIMAVLKQHEKADKLFNVWGLGDTIEYGRGMTMMFWGSPGTGKTFGAHCIARALGTSLLVISAAEIQSSEPGAANRNIQEAFKTAKEAGQVLFLDECDSLITTRSDLGMVLASEVNTLLTEIEKFEGVCILATNRIETMDEALERRIALIVEFPLPKYAQRVEIWKKMLPKKMPLEKGVEASTLAQKKLSGGQIKNVILQAARLAAADDGKHVSAENFARALERLEKSAGIMGHRGRSATGRPGPKEGPTMEVHVQHGNHMHQIQIQPSGDVDKSENIDLETFLADDEEEKENGNEL